MTKNELNRDIRRLYRAYENREDFSGSDYYAKETEWKNELARLWNADREKTWTGHRELKMLLVMNQSWRVVTLHQLATGIKIT